MGEHEIKRKTFRKLKCVKKKVCVYMGGSDGNGVEMFFGEDERVDYFILYKISSFVLYIPKS